MKEKVKKISKNVMKKAIKYYNNIIKSWNKFLNYKYIKPIFDFLPHNIFLFILFIICIFTIFSFYKKNNDTALYTQNISDGIVDPIMINPYNYSFDNIKLTNDPDKICFTFATYARTNHSEYKYVLYQKKDTVFEYQFNASILKDGEKYCFDLPTVSKENINDYSISFIPIKSDSDNAITIYKNVNTNEPTMSIISHQEIISIRNIIIIFFCLCFFAINYLLNKRKIKPEYYWLLISLVYLFSACFITPPYQVPDEPIHYLNTYRLTQIDYTKSIYDNIENGTITMPENSACINYSGIQKINKVSNFNDVLECAKAKKNVNDDTYSWYKSHNTKLGYIFSAIGIKIGDKLSNSPLFIFFTGRIFNLILSIIIIFIAIKIIPKYKEILLSVATIPMFIQEMASYSYDSVVNTFSLLILAIIIKMIYDKKVKWVLKTIILLILGIFIANIKMIYLPIYLFILLVPNDKFKKWYYKYLYCFGLIVGAYLLNNLLNAKVFFNNGISSNVIVSNPNLELIKNNPLSLFSIAYYTIKFETAFYARSLFAYFGWFTFRFQDILIFAFIIYNLYLLANNNKLEGKWFDKLIILIGLLLGVAAVFASMYFYWSKPGLGYVEGVQGRYFLPLLMPFIIIFMFGKKNKIKKIDYNINYLFINIMVLQYILTLLIQYY